MTRQRYEQDKHIQIKNGSILITKDGTLGKVAYVQGLSMPATLNAGVFNVEIKDETKVDNIGCEILGGFRIDELIVFEAFRTVRINHGFEHGNYFIGLSVGQRIKTNLNLTER